jgi:site-specific DNA recombinase
LGILKTEQYEEAKSAKVSGQRKVFAKMVKDLRSKRVNAIICWKLDRLARNMIEGGEVIDLLQQGVIKAIITPHKIYYPNENALLMAVEFGAANQYSRDLSQNVKRGQVRKAKNGCPPSRACIGFINDQSGGKGEKGWLIDETRLPIIKQMFQMYLSGNYSGAKIHEWAYQIGKLTTVPRKKSGNRIISRAGVYRMLSDPIYAGFFYLQGERYELASELPRIISEVEHYTILRMLGGSTASKPKSYEVIYSGYIKSPYGESVGPDIKMQIICDCKLKFSYINKAHCPRCNTEIVNLSNPKYLHYIYYRNIARSKRHESIKYILEDDVTDALIGYIKGNLVMCVNLSDFCIAYIGELDKYSNEVAIEKNRKKRIHDLEIKKIRYREMLADGLFSKEEYLVDIDKINREISGLQPTVSTKRLLEKSTKYFTVGLTIIRTFDSKSASVEDKRYSLSLLDANLQWDEKNLIIMPTKIIQRIIDGLDEAQRYNKLFTPESTLAEKDETGVFESIRPILCKMCDDVRKLILAMPDDQE